MRQNLFIGICSRELSDTYSSQPRLAFISKKNPDAPQFEVFTDSDYAGERKCRSTSGYLIYYRGNLISWCSRLQKTVARSSQEAEYRALNEATYELLFLTRLTEELLGPVLYPVTIREDNIATIAHCQPGSNKGRSKHIDLQYYLVKQSVLNGQIVVVQVSSENNLADVLTKPLTELKFKPCRDAIVKAFA